MDGAERLERATRERPKPEPARPRRSRPAAAALLLVALAAGLVFVRARPQSDAASPPAAATMPPPTTTTLAVADTSALRTLFADAGACADVPGTEPHIHCYVDGVTIDARLLDVETARSAYVRESSARISPRTGEPACAHGRPDERAWSRPAAPTRPVGRYHCRVERGHAAIWWTDEHGLVAHAVGPDGDLAALFRWWRAHNDG